MPLRAPPPPPSRPGRGFSSTAAFEHRPAGILEGVPHEGGEVSRPRAATCVPDIHDRHHRSVTDQDIAGVERSAWTMSGASRGGGTSAHVPQALDQGRYHGGIPRAWPRTGGDATAPASR